MRKTLLCALGLMSLFSVKECRADIAMIGGYGQTTFGSSAPQYPLANSLSIGKSLSPSLTLPPNASGQIIAVAIDPLTGDVIFGGGLTEGGLPVVYRGSVINSSLSVVSLSSDVSLGGGIISVAFDSKGTAILGGQTSLDSSPAAYRLPRGSSQVTSISLPGGITNGIINAIAIFPNNTAILIGVDNTDSTPLVYRVSEGSTEATKLSLPNPSITGELNCVAVSSNGTAILAGGDFTNNQALIYRLDQSSLTLEPISTPGTNDGGVVESVAFTSNGTAILAGRFSDVPLIYSISSGSSSASLIMNPNGNEGYLTSVVVGSDNVALLGGLDSTNDLPIIYRVTAGSTQATSIAVPISVNGLFFSGAIGSENVAVFVGADYNSDPIVYTVSTSSDVATAIILSQPFTESICTCVAIYSSNGLYDKRRISPYYYLQLDETKNALQQAGLL